jgi:hypothetical protein
LRWQSIDEIGYGGESFIPKLYWHARVGEEGEPYLDYVAILVIDEAVLLMGVRT